MPAGQAIKAKDSRSDSWVSLEPAGRKQGLVALVFVEMMNASWTRIYRFPRTLDGFFNAFTPGWPPYLYRVSQLAGLFGWPHHVHINWPNGNGKTFVKNAVLHRVADILGGLSLAAHDGLPVGEFVSWKGGHKLDLEIIKQI